MERTSPAPPIQSNFTLTKPLLALIITGGSFLVVVIFALLTYQVYFLYRVYPGVQLGGFDISQIDETGLQTLVGAQAAQLRRRPLTLQADGMAYTFTAAELGATTDEAQTVAAAFAVGRQGPFLVDLKTQLRLLNRPTSIVPQIGFNSGPANTVLLSIAQNINRPAQDARLILHPDLSLEVIPAQTGQTLDIEATREKIRQAVLSKSADAVPLVIQRATPAVTQAEPARQTLAALLSGPQTFTFNDQSWTLSPEQLAAMLAISADPAPAGSGQITLALNQAALAAYFHGLSLEIDQSPIDAWFTFDEKTKRLTPIIQSQTGYTLDVADAVLLAEDMLKTPQQHTWALPVIVEVPAVSSENPAELGITDLINEATTYFKGSSAERMQNIQVSASKFHGLVVPPGGIFSFNEHLGDVTAGNGFVESLIIQGDRTAVGIGGGVCQVSTTAFRAAFFGGYELVERWAHGYRVGWYETGSVPGLDATIYSPTVDFKFKNDTASYLLIQTETDLKAGTVAFRFYGAPTGRTVIVSDPVQSNVQPHGPDIWQEDPSLKPGEIKQVDWAKDGVDITIQRTVKQGETILHQDTIFSRYRPWQNIYKIGPTASD